MMTEKKSSRVKSDQPRKGELKEFRKTNEAIGLRITEGHLSLLSRKLFNVMVYHAQQLQVPGANSPISTEASKQYFWIPLAEVARDAAYESNDTEKLKAHLEELQNIRVHMEDGIQWTSQRLVSAVTLVNPAGLKKKGGQLWFGFAFPPEVASSVMSPGSYTKLAIYYQTLFRSGASLALYEICRRYLTNPSKLTSRNEWEWWYGALTGNPISDTIPEYKYFKRDVMKPAIAEINMVTDIQIEMIEHRQGRRVIALQFKVDQSPQTTLGFPAAPVIDSALLARIMALGIGQEDASNLLATYDEARLNANLALVEQHVAEPGKSKIESPAAYFKQALKAGYATAEQIAQTSRVRLAKTQPPALETPEELLERYLAARAKEAYQLYLELDQGDQDHWLATFKQTKKPGRATISATLASALFRNEFSRWYAQQQWKDPTSNDVLKFAIAFPKAAPPA